MRIHYIQHEPFEDLGCIREWLSTKKFQVTHTHVWQGESYPDPIDIDFLIIMGGSMSAYDDALLPWLKDEKQCILSCIQQGKKVLGICLGAQLLASVLGANVFPGKEKEIGWFPVNFTRDCLMHPLFEQFPQQLRTMHWHGDTFHLPEKSILIGSSLLTVNQGFIYNDKVVALQFHPEMTEKAIQGMIDETGELIPAAYVQSIEEIKANFSYCQQNNTWMFSLLDRLSAM